MMEIAMQTTGEDVGKPRKILHIDMDAFFVSVELLKRPELRGKPVIVGGKSPRGVVSTCSYEARKYGIHSAMPSVRAHRLCPHAVWLNGDYAAYSYYSKRVFDILRRYSPEVVQLSIDEGRVDLTGSEALFGPATDIAHRIVNEIRNELGLPVSGGLANSGTGAKIAAELGKPDGLTVILPGYEQSFLSPLPVERIPGVGAKSTPRFNRMGIFTIGDLIRLDDEQLQRNFGKGAARLKSIATGRPDTVHRRAPQSPSRGHEETFPVNLTSRSLIKLEIRRLVEKLCYRLRKEGFSAKTITVKIRDGGFNTFTRSRSLSAPTNNDQEIFDIASGIILNNIPRGGVRLIGVSAHNLVKAQLQLELFSAGGKKKHDHFYKTVDRIKNQYGRHAVGFGRCPRTERQSDPLNGGRKH